MRIALERLLRAASLALLAAMIWMSLARASTRDTRDGADRGALDRALRRWTFAPPDSAHVRLDSVPPPAVRDWLGALRRTGVRLSWSSPALPATAVEAQPLAAPLGLTRVLVASPGDPTIVLVDRAGVVDTLPVDAKGASGTIAVAAGEIRARAGRHEAATVARDSILPRRVLVIGAAGWESKFVIAALEEAGWRVDARMPVAPGVDVRQGEPRSPDTARYAAVVLLDESQAPEVVAIPEYVRTGGGLVLVGTAARRPALVRIAPAAVGARLRPQSISFASTAPRRALAGYSLVRLREGAVPLEARDGAVTAAAMRVGAGRVTQIGYDESWRWRFTGGDGAPAAHRSWWSRVVASAAYRATMPVNVTAQGESAPLAALHASLGPASPQLASAPPARSGGGLRWWMLVALLAFLLAEWGSRRLRGAA